MRQPARHRRPVPLLARALAAALAAAAALLALAAGFVPGILGASAAPVRPIPAAVPVALSVPVLPPPAAPRAVTARVYTVRAGDTLSGVAARLCGKAADWTGIYAASRAARMTAADANVLAAGQHLAVSCRRLPAMLKYALEPRPAAPVITTVTVTTAAPAPRRAVVPSRRGPAAARPAAPASAGTYSYAALETLWESAGGPAWAAPHAAEIAMCESGGRVSAYNPSGATGLWQILGSVVPGSLYSPFVNALNAVAKFRASGDAFTQWVCR